LLLLLLLLPVLPCLATDEFITTRTDCGAALEQQDTVCSLRSESSEKDLKDLLADHKAALQELRGILDKNAAEQRSFAADMKRTKHSMEKAIAEYKHIMEMAAVEQKRSGAKWTIEELRAIIYMLGTSAISLGGFFYGIKCAMEMLWACLGRQRGVR
jgi:hypothetical protein